MVTLIGVLTGALLGTRYKVLCLVPIILVGTAALAVIDRFNDVPASSTALTALALGLALQIGYLVGFTARSVLLAALTRRQPQRSRGARAISPRGFRYFLKDGANRVACNSDFESLEEPPFPFVRAHQPQVPGADHPLSAACCLPWRYRRR